MLIKNHLKGRWQIKSILVNTPNSQKDVYKIYGI